MKKFTFMLGLLLASLVSVAQENVVNVPTAGTLQQVLEAEGLTSASDLTITGELNGDDIRLIRAMAGGYFDVIPYLHVLRDKDYELAIEPTYTLKNLDLSGAKIVSGGDMYALCSISSLWMDTAHYTADDVVGRVMFSYLASLESLVLPQQLTRIRRNAFYYSDLLSELEIPEGVKDIESAAFSCCANLKTLSLPSTLQTVDGHAFTNDNPEQCLSVLTVNAVEPPVVFSPETNSSYFSFSDEFAERCSLVVPDESVEKYREHPQWGRFRNIGSNKAPTTIQQVEQADAAASAWYGCDGKQLSAPVKGLNIVKMADGTVKKVIVR